MYLVLAMVEFEQSKRFMVDVFVDDTSTIQASLVVRRLVLKHNVKYIAKKLYNVGSYHTNLTKSQ